MEELYICSSNPSKNPRTSIFMWDTQSNN